MSLAISPLALSYVALLATAIGISGGLAILSAVIVRRRGRETSAAVLLGVAAFAMLGFVVGLIMAQSREAVVDVVLPAILTLLGGILAYLIGAKGIQTQIGASAMVLCFAFALLVGSQYGAKLRFDYEMAMLDPAYLIAREDFLQQARHELALKRLANQTELLMFIRDLAGQKGLDAAQLYSSVSEVKVESKPAPASAKE
jgi:hypothetical protein